MTESVEQPSKNVESLSKTLKILKALTETSGAVRVADLARSADLDRSSSQRAVRTLEHLRLIVRDGAGNVVLPGLGLMRYGNVFLASNDFLRTAMPLVVDLSDRVGLGCDLWLADGKDLIHLARAPGSEGREQMAATGGRLNNPLVDSPKTLERGWTEGPDDRFIQRISAPIYGDSSTMLGVLSVDRTSDVDDAAAQFHELAQQLSETARELSSMRIRPWREATIRAMPAVMSKPDLCPEDPLVINAVVRAFWLLNSFEPEKPALTLTELHRITRFSVPMVQRLTKTLVIEGYLSRDEATKTFSLGSRVLDLAHCYQSQTPALKLIWPHLVAIRRRTGLRASFCVLDGEEVVYLLHVQGSAQGDYRTAFVGRRLPALQTAGGRAMLSRVSPQQLDQLLTQAPISKITPYTLTDPALIQHEITKAAQSGVAYSNQQSILDEVNAAAAIESGPSGMLGALVVSAPLRDWSIERLQQEIAPLLISTASAISSPA